MTFVDILTLITGIVQLIPGMALTRVGAVHIHTVTMSTDGKVAFTFVNIFAFFSVICRSVPNIAFAAVIARAIPMVSTPFFSFNFRQVRNFDGDFKFNVDTLAIDACTMWTANVWVLITVENVRTVEPVANIPWVALTSISTQCIKTLRIAVTSVGVVVTFVDVNALDPVAFEPDRALAGVGADFVSTFGVGIAHVNIL